MSSFSAEFHAAMKRGGTKRTEGPDDFARSFRGAFQSGDASLRAYTAPPERVRRVQQDTNLARRTAGSDSPPTYRDGLTELARRDAAKAVAERVARRYSDPLTGMAREAAARAEPSGASDGARSGFTHSSGKLDDAPTYGIGKVPPGTPGGGGRGYSTTAREAEPKKRAFRDEWRDFWDDLKPSAVLEGSRQYQAEVSKRYTDDYIDPEEAAAFAFFKPALSVGEAIARSFDRDFGDEESHRQMDSFGNDLADMLAKAKTEQPLAYWLGSAAGDLALTAGLGSAVGAIPGVSTLPSAARGAVTGAAALGGREFVQGIGDAAAGRTNARDFTRDVLASGLTGGLTGAGTAVIGDALSAAAKPRLRMEDFVNPDSPVWTNVSYEDVQTQNRIMLDTHREMVEAGQTVTVPSQTMETVAKYYPDLRSMPKSERMPVLRRAMTELKDNLRQFLDGLKGSYDFEVNGYILDARLYSTGVREVMQGVTQPKAAMLYASEDIFRNARYLYSTPDYAGNPNIFRWNYFYTPVQIGDETLGVRIAVRDMAKGTFLEPESQIYHWGLK